MLFRSEIMKKKQYLIIGSNNFWYACCNSKKEAFEEYDPIGQIFIKDTVSFMSYLKTFSDTITLEIVEEYILKITGDKREGYVTLGSDLVCENLYTKDLPVIPDTQLISLTKNDFKVVKNDMSLLGIGQIKLLSKDNMLEVQVGQKGESDYFVNSIDLKDKKVEKECQVNINKCLILFLNSVMFILPLLIRGIQTM